jgi:hypothetical protein
MSNDKPLSLISSDEEAEDFVGSADLTGYDLSALTPTRFEFGSKDARVNMRLRHDDVNNKCLLGIIHQRGHRDAHGFPSKPRGLYYTTAVKSHGLQPPDSEESSPNHTLSQNSR